MGRYVERTLLSAINQTYRDLEILVVDDGSSDDTRDIISSYTHKDKRVRLLTQQNAGVAAARNAGIRASVGRFIAPLDADDLWHPEKIERQVSRLHSVGPKVGVVYCGSALIDANDYVLRRPLGLDPFDFEGKIVPALIWRNFGCASVPLIRREAMLSAGGYDERLRAARAEGCEDKDLYLRLAENWSFARVDATLVGHRVHLDSMSHRVRSMYRSHRKVIEAAYRRNPRLPPKLIRWSNARVSLACAVRATMKQNTFGGLGFLLRALVKDPAYVFTSSLRLTGGKRSKLNQLWYVRGDLRFSEIPTPQPGGPAVTILNDRHKLIATLCARWTAQNNESTAEIVTEKKSVVLSQSPAAEDHSLGLSVAVPQMPGNER
jgi:glycosyltransferase involved in cell wall biosynthesis